MSNETHLVLSKVGFFDQAGNCIMEGSFKTIPKEGEEFYIHTEDRPRGFLYRVITVKRYYLQADNKIKEENYKVYVIGLSYGAKE